MKSWWRRNCLTLVVLASVVIAELNTAWLYLCFSTFVLAFVSEIEPPNKRYVGKKYNSYYVKMPRDR